MKQAIWIYKEKVVKIARPELLSLGVAVHILKLNQGGNNRD